MQNNNTTAPENVKTVGNKFSDVALGFYALFLLLFSFFSHISVLLFFAIAALRAVDTKMSAIELCSLLIERC